MAKASSIRSQRLAGTLRKHLSADLGRDIADPRLAGVSVQEVDLAPDLSLATITVRIDYGDDGEDARRELLQLLGRLTPRLRANLAPQLRMRRVPDLRFRYDTGLDHARRIAAVLEEIREEDAQRAAVDPEEGGSPADEGEDSPES